MTNSPDPLADATDAWISVVRTYHQCTATIARKVAPLGITLLQHEILMNLLRSPGLTQQELAERCFSAKSGISMLIASFEKDSIIQRDSDPADKRVRRLTLTQDGQELAQKALVVQREVVAEMASVYAPEELPVLKQRMDDVTKLLQQIQKDAEKD